MGRRESVTAKANTMEQPNVITDAIHIEAVLSCSERPCSRCKKDVLNVVGMTAEGSQPLQVFSMDPGTAQALAPAIEAIRPAYPSLARIACLATQRGTVVAATCPFCAQALPCTHLSFKLETLPIEQVTVRWTAPIPEPAVTPDQPSPPVPAPTPAAAQQCLHLTFEEALA